MTRSVHRHRLPLLTGLMPALSTITIVRDMVVFVLEYFLYAWHTTTPKAATNHTMNRASHSTRSPWDPGKRTAEPTRGLVRQAALNPKCGSLAPPLTRRPTGGPCHSAGRAAWAAANPWAVPHHLDPGSLFRRGSSCSCRRQSAGFDLFKLLSIFIYYFIYFYYFYYFLLFNF